MTFAKRAFARANSRMRSSPITAPIFGWRRKTPDWEVSPSGGRNETSFIAVELYTPR